MSRVGKYPVKLQGVQATAEGKKIKIKGQQGELTFEVPALVTFEIANDEVKFAPANNTKQAKILWGTARAIVNTMVVGVKDGYKIEMELQGTGYRAAMQGKYLNLFLGFSHEIKFVPPAGVKIVTPTQTEIVVTGADKQLVGQVAAEIRNFRKPEPYKGKGVRIKGEYVRRKEGKKK